MEPININGQKRQKIRAIAQYLENLAESGELDQADLSAGSLKTQEIAEDIINLLNEFN